MLSLRRDEHVVLAPGTGVHLDYLAERVLVRDPAPLLDVSEDQMVEVEERGRRLVGSRTASSNRELELAELGSCLVGARSIPTMASILPV